MRENGFYWVKKYADNIIVSEKWQVAEWFGSFWIFDAATYNNDYFEFINETRILDPDEQAEEDFQLKADNEH